MIRCQKDCENNLNKKQDFFDNYYLSFKYNDNRLIINQIMQIPKTKVIFTDIINKPIENSNWGLLSSTNNTIQLQSNSLSSLEWPIGSSGEFISINF